MSDDSLEDAWCKSVRNSCFIPADDLFEGGIAESLWWQYLISRR